MDTYVAYAYYTATYKGTAIKETAFAPIALSASIELDALTFGKIRRAGLSSYDTDIQDLIETATCILADTINEIQESTGSASGVSGVTSESVGGYSYSVDASSRTYEAMMQIAHKRVKTILMSTGLLSASVGGTYRPRWLT